MIALEIVHYLLLIYIGASVLTYAILATYHFKIKNQKNKQNKFVVFIPSYKEDNVIYDVAKEVLNQDYPTALFDIIVIADSLSKKTLDDLNSLPITVKGFFDKSTRQKHYTWQNCLKTCMT
jgi:cellulose synthase/poly-beta-1,6-N-acetylglucosamine synthase-like glycosyltransferase